LTPATGGFGFIHRYGLDYFAALWEMEYTGR
jgi:hypothetical protein